MKGPAGPIRAFLYAVGSLDERILALAMLFSLAVPFGFVEDEFLSHHEHLTPP